MSAPPSTVSTPINTSNGGQLDSNGNGTLKLGPADPHVWLDTVVAILVTPPPGTVNPKTPTCNYFIGPRADPVYLIDTTTIGNRNSSSRGARFPITPGNYVWVQWTGGQPNSTTVLSVFATEYTQ